MADLKPWRGAGGGGGGHGRYCKECRHGHIELVGQRLFWAGQEGNGGEEHVRSAAKGAGSQSNGVLAVKTKHGRTGQGRARGKARAVSVARARLTS